MNRQAKQQVLAPNLYNPSHASDCCLNNIQVLAYNHIYTHNFTCFTPIIIIIAEVGIVRVHWNYFLLPHKLHIAAPHRQPQHWCVRLARTVSGIQPQPQPWQTKKPTNLSKEDGRPLTKIITMDSVSPPDSLHLYQAGQCTV